MVEVVGQAGRQLATIPGREGKGCAMGRPEVPLPQPDGPVRDLAAGLRRLRRDSGGRSYRQLARSANVAAATLARAASGHRLPSWEVTRAFVQACGGDPALWRSLWER